MLFMQRLRHTCKWFGVGAGAISSYIGVEYQRSVGIKSEKTVHENVFCMGKWLKWKFGNTLLFSENCIIKCCHWCSTSPLFHYLDLTSFLIFLANRENTFLHNMCVKLLASIEIPEDADINHYRRKCTNSVKVGLARYHSINQKWFLKEGEYDEVDESTLRSKIDNIVAVIKSVLGERVQDECCLWLFNSIIQQKLPSDPIANMMVDLSSVRDDIEFTSENDEIEFSDMVPTYLEILRRYSNKDEVASNASISNEILFVTKYLSLMYPERSDVLVACGNILANLAVYDFNRTAIIESDILSLLVKWKNSSFMS